jgi:hypothetical protein
MQSPCGPASIRRYDKCQGGEQVSLRPPALRDSRLDAC